MDPLGVLLIFVYFACYYQASYLVLTLAGVKKHRSKRAFMFVLTILSLQIVTPLIMGLLAGDFGALFGSALGLVMSYKYVSCVLKIHWAINIAILVFLHLVSSVLIGVAYLAIFELTGGLGYA